MKNKYLLDFQNYLQVLNFKFIIEYYSDDTLKLNVENEDGKIKIIYEDISDNADAHIIDYHVHNFLCDYVQELLLAYDDLNITRFYEPWRGFVIDGIIFNIENYKGDYSAFLKNILRFAEECTKH